MTRIIRWTLHVPDAISSSREDREEVEHSGNWVRNERVKFARANRNYNKTSSSHRNFPGDCCTLNIFAAIRIGLEVDELRGVHEKFWPRSLIAH
ncbi:GM25071 [Drosophila sechellia]|uniref:GM25071 n=1 Tax=Drosophila sechellia TaxID=7238 RepID=B4IQC5_DROSE|nr:GM25071 [Drosophila sechellia]